MKTHAGRQLLWVSPLLLASMGLPACEHKPAGSGAAPNAQTDSQVAHDEHPPIRFTDITAQTGINFRMTAGARPATEILEVKGGGLALIDFDNDGLLDLFVPNGATLAHPDNGPGCKLYRNLGHMQFTDVTRQAGLTFNRWGMGVAIGDYDGNGFDDIFISSFGKNALLRNNGDGTFTDVTDSAGVGHESWGTGCAWSDLDGDGDLDLYVACFLEFDPAHPPAHMMFKGVDVFAGPMGLPPMRDVLYENLGDGTFRDVTDASGCGAREPQFGLNVAILDFDGDNKPDIFVGNDSTPNFLYQNLGGMHFKDVGVRAGVAANGEGAYQATMGIAIADVNDDTRPDIFTSNFSSDTNTLHINLGNMLFEDRTQLYGLGSVSTTYLGWATAFCDFNNDGAEDLIVFNGHVYPYATRANMDSDFLQTPLLFERRGKRFQRVMAKDSGTWLEKAYCDRSAVFGDLDHDGDIDIIVGELNGPIRVLRNDRDGGAWLTVELLDSRSDSKNHRAIGSIVDVVDGAQTQRRWVYSGGSFQSASSLAAHFGLADATGKCTVRITWPDGLVSALEPVLAGKSYIVERTSQATTIRAK